MAVTVSGLFSSLRTSTWLTTLREKLQSSTAHQSETGSSNITKSPSDPDGCRTQYAYQIWGSDYGVGCWRCDWPKFEWIRSVDGSIRCPHCNQLDPETRPRAHIQAGDPLKLNHVGDHVYEISRVLDHRQHDRFCVGGCGHELLQFRQLQGREPG